MKSIIKTIGIEKISEKLGDFFSTVEAIARQTKFVQRKSAMTGLKFLQTQVFGFMGNPKASLVQLAQESSRLGVDISPQGIDARINPYSVDFMKEMYLKALAQFKSQQALPIDIVKQFTKLFLVDSTFKPLPDSMAEEFPGSGGKASKASLKVQLVFEFIYGNLAQLVVEAGRSADQAYIQYLNLLEAGSLVIMDLGYFRLASLRSIADKGAYFIMRYHYSTSLFHPNGTKIDLLNWVQNHEQRCLEIPILLGASPKQQLACRLISTPVPPAVAEERRRKAKRSARTHGKELSEAYLRLLGWSIFLTNVPTHMLSTPQVVTFYRIRWQIELIFKLWKSYCGLEHNLSSRKERVLTEFYAKLLVIVLTIFIVSPLRIPDDAHLDREISPVQVRNILANFAHDIAAKLSDLIPLQKVFHDLYTQIARFGFKQIRRKKPNVCALLAQISMPVSDSILA
jgi:hypothetical protein